jgi:3-oxoacyl-[acyl-carrier-protein] synthase II
LKRKRAVLTGIGAIAPNALGKKHFWQALKEGKSGIKSITRFDVSSYPTQIAGQIDDFDPLDYNISPKESRKLSLAAQFALSATQMAIDDAEIQKSDLEKAGVLLGVSGSATDIIESQHGAFMTKGLSRMSPSGIVSIIPSASANSISIKYKCKGTVITISNSCAAGMDALGYAFRSVSLGEDEIIIAGGTESQITPFGLALFTGPRFMSTRNDEPEKASRPFDKDRDGGVLSEGAGVFIIEELNHALDRGAHIYAEVVGYSSKADGSAHSSPETLDTGIRRSMFLALIDSGLDLEDIGYVCAHGPSDDFDRIESIAIKNVLGDHAYKIPVSSIKSMIGNPLSAAGALQLVASAMVLEDCIIPPTINHEMPDIDCDLDYVPQKSREASNINGILINSHGFGGVNSSLVIKRYNDN